MDKNFVNKLIQYMIIDGEGNEIDFGIHRFRMFKVEKVEIGLEIDLFIYSRVFFEILVWI
jgi:hypothetical protein